jgi:beta-lactamase regulating signal transducer with metallopeptidase domain
MNAIEWLDRLWVAMLALSLGVAVVLILRKPWQRAFGAEQSCRLWWLPLLALLVSQLPHAIHGSQVLPIWLSVRWDTVPAAIATDAGTARNPGVWWLAAWLVGGGAVLLREVVRQYRFALLVRRQGRPMSRHAGLPVVRLAKADQGPALFGFWRPRILVPVDFERCYDADERALILAHECMHARRGDLPCLLIGVLLRTAFWFNPLFWWALRCLRQDQELACDAAMLRQKRISPRRYADVLLKAQLSSMLPAPIGCAWRTHPVKERIAMLKQTRPDFLRRSSGILSAVLLATGLAAGVYAHTAKPGQAAVTASGDQTGPEYQLSIGIQVDSRQGEDLHALSSNMALCLHTAQHGQVMLGDVALDTQLHVLSNDRVALYVKVDQGAYAPAAKQLSGVLGHAMHAEFHGEGEAAARARRVVLDVTPVQGCPARDKVSTKMHDKSVREAAKTVAKTAGLTLDNAQALSMRAVSLHFKDMAPMKAIQLLAQIDGKRAVFDGRHVRFEAQ